MYPFLAQLPAPIRTVMSWIVTIILCVICLCLLAWMLHWGKQYFTFLPWP